MPNLFSKGSSKAAVFFLPVLLAGALHSSAHAGTITIGTTGVSAPNHTVNFDTGAMGANVSNQFSGSGLTISTLSGLGLVLTNNSQCNNSGAGVTNQYLYMGINYPCSFNSTSDAASIQFSSDVSELSWTGFSRATSTGFLLQALNNGSVVSSTIFNGTNQFENKTVLFSGSIFDELRFIENGSSSQFFALDNMAWKSAQVPLPGTLALLGIGGLGLVVSRRKTKKAS